MFNFFHDLQHYNFLDSSFGSTLNSPCTPYLDDDLFDSLDCSDFNVSPPGANEVCHPLRPSLDLILNVCFLFRKFAEHINILYH